MYYSLIKVNGCKDIENYIVLGINMLFWNILYICTGYTGFIIYTLFHILTVFVLLRQ